MANRWGKFVNNVRFHFLGLQHQCGQWLQPEIKDASVQSVQSLSHVWPPDMRANHINKSPKCSTFVQSQKWQNDLCSFPRQTIHYHVIQVYAPTTNAEEAEVEWFFEENMLTPWNSYDKPRLLQSRDITFLTSLNSQSFGFSSSHIWMWELHHKEGWALRNWCFRIVLLEKSPKSECLRL